VLRPNRGSARKARNEVIHGSIRRIMRRPRGAQAARREPLYFCLLFQHTPGNPP
jgi:hypothetical protein